MRRVHLASLGSDVPQLGAGCASLGSRISAAQGLASLELLYEKGVQWFDVAPSYGDGAAELLLGRFLKERGGQAFVCTKVGFTPNRPSAPARLLKPLARAVVKALPGARQLMRRRQSASRLDLTGEVIAASLNNSLSRLGREQVDVLALHEPEPDQVFREDVLRAIEEAKRSGKIRAASLASYPADAAMLAERLEQFDILQIPNNALEPGIPVLRSNVTRQAYDVITHSAFGASESIAKIARFFRTNEPFRRAAEEIGYAGEAGAVSAALLADYAFCTNPAGVILMSMFQPSHIDSNVARASKEPNAAVVRLFEQIRPRLADQGG